MKDVGIQAAVADPRSASEKYQDLVVGSRDFFRLVHFECVVLFTSWVPGALGLLLRKIFYPTLLGSCGRGVVFGQGVTLRHPHKIHIGEGTVIDDQVLLDAKGVANQGIRIGERGFIGRNTILSCKDGDISAIKEEMISPIAFLVLEADRIKAGLQRRREIARGIALAGAPVVVDQFRGGDAESADAVQIQP